MLSLYHRNAERQANPRCAPGLYEIEAGAAYGDLIIRHAQAAAGSRVEQALTIGDDDVDATETFATAVGRLDEADGGVVEREFEAAARIVAQRHLGDFAPTISEPTGVGGLHLDGAVRADDVVAAATRILSASARSLRASCFA